MPVFQPRATKYIAALPSPQREICQALRKQILETFPQIREKFKWGYPAYYCNGKRLCLIGGHKTHVTLELFYGAHLHDAQGRIVGMGKHTRHIQLASPREIDERYLADLIRQSLELSQAGAA